MSLLWALPPLVGCVSQGSSGAPGMSIYHFYSLYTVFQMFGLFCSLVNWGFSYYWVNPCPSYHRKYPTDPINIYIEFKAGNTDFWFVGQGVLKWVYQCTCIIYWGGKPHKGPHTSGVIRHTTCHEGEAGSCIVYAIGSRTMCREASSGVPWDSVTAIHWTSFSNIFKCLLKYLLMNFVRPT